MIQSQDQHSQSVTLQHAQQQICWLWNARHRHLFTLHPPHSSSNTLPTHQIHTHTLLQLTTHILNQATSASDIEEHCHILQQRYQSIDHIHEQQIYRCREQLVQAIPRTLQKINEAQQLIHQAFCKLNTLRALRNRVCQLTAYIQALAARKLIKRKLFTLKRFRKKSRAFQALKKPILEGRLESGVELAVYLAKKQRAPEGLPKVIEQRLASTQCCLIESFSLALLKTVFGMQDSLKALEILEIGFALEKLEKRMLITTIEQHAVALLHFFAIKQQIQLPTHIHSLRPHLPVQRLRLLAELRDVDGIPLQKTLELYKAGVERLSAFRSTVKLILGKVKDIGQCRFKDQYGHFIRYVGVVLAGFKGLHEELNKQLTCTFSKKQQLAVRKSIFPLPL